ncbi:MAG TPA: cbb3-type cytochrome c oxidase subunit 3 [Caulobacteraceae bacterium]|nr:cbb3-type cytochrome c oxidase subunit 3 [Caulobacteraceae bacterium]
MATYELFARIAQQVGTVYFALIFIAVLVYVMWPSNKPEFDKAARAALDAEE